MLTPVVQETRRAGQAPCASTAAYAPSSHRPGWLRETGSARVLDPDTLGDHLDRLFRAAWALCGSREEAEDLVQETYASVLARPRLVRGDGDLRYLLRALRNTFISQRRAAARRPRKADVELEALALPDKGGGVADPPAATEAREIYGAIAALPDEFRDALVAIDVVGMSYREAARALHVREGTITSRLHRARGRIAESLSTTAQDSTGYGHGLGEGR